MVGAPKVFTVELMRDGKAVQRAEVQADNAVEAAKTWGAVTIPFAEEPQFGEWIRVTHPDGITTTWFEVDR
ncbi:hypothetical protein LB566_27200 [Mesorhizobium sp. CA13]|uniref:hypothetical protein n=1 Tax=unclassified Mesorhizobium TaxID=325217 RepID=UPI0011292297|nr:MULTISPECIES: hypothetical protein [unclassified Mesorhizobium]MBZ9857478.1 hypothetical protein [Mesorhizobium sp. CA13]MBZ9966683.1 hypothetical protein [Mesorhizobium sp. BR1-1-2]MCA0014847.1 hypothetical protein [Mesorhizobium sp. B294B1A1]MCA0041033.1 hypothetical protein [Mesorhizobium sp. B292B1B]TPM38036.1 hypothetical protein FJ964_29345 [Mesorhizobium sp. B2-3-2]